MKSRKDTKHRSKVPKVATDVANMPVLVPRPDGRGALLSGGVPGHAPSPGRPPNELRARMRQHLDQELIQACLDDWKSGKLSALQVGEFFAKYAIPMQSEKLDESEGKSLIVQTLHRMVDELLAAGVEHETVKAAYETATRGLG